MHFDYNTSMKLTESEFFQIFKQTFLKVSRLHEVLPKYSKATGSWELMIIIGNIRFSSSGHKYHLSCAITSSISSKVLLIRCPSSQNENATPNALQALKTVLNKIATLAVG